MQPSQDQNIASGELPSPEYAYGEQPQSQEGELNEQQNAAAIEQGYSQPQPIPTAPPMTPVAADQMPEPPLPPAFNPGGVGGTSVPMPEIADDSDLIEKEWVTKAKHIVEHTKHDPYVQNQEVNKMKAEYLKKRYNKDLKLSDS